MMEATRKATAIGVAALASVAGIALLCASFGVLYSVRRAEAAAIALPSVPGPVPWGHLCTGRG